MIGPPEEGRQGSVQMPQCPLRPGRPAFSKRARFWVAVGLLSALLVAAVVGAILAHSSPPRGHFVTIPKADRNASPTLIRAAESPHLQKLFASLDPKHVAFVAVDANGEDAPSVFAYHVFYGFGFPAVLDPSGHAVSFPKHGHMGPISKSYKIAEYPTFYVLDPSGRVVWRSDGEQPDALLRHELQLAAAKT